MKTLKSSSEVNELVSMYIPELPTERIARVAQSVDATARLSFLGAARAELAWPSHRDERDPEFEFFLRDLARVNLDDFSENLAGNPAIVNADAVFDGVVESLAQGLARLLVRTLVRMLAEHDSIWHHPNLDSESNFDSFCYFLRTPEGQRYFMTHQPGAFNLAADLICQHIAVSTEIIERVSTNLSALCDSPWGPKAGAGLVALDMGAGDTHAGHRSVTILTFSDGTKVVLKPRDTRIEVAYNEFVRWSNEQGFTQLPVVRQLTASGYGFSEFIESGETRRDHKFYDAIGQLLAIHFLLGGSDLHYENLLTDARNRPVVVDAETLLAPRRNDALSPKIDQFAPAVRNAVSASVLGVGLLPAKMVSADKEAPALDIGAVGYQPGQQSPFRVLRSINAGRDDMRLELARITLEGGPQPVADLDVVARRDAIQAGLRRTLLGIYSRRDEVADFVVTHFAGLEARLVVVPTVFYAQLLRMATHPLAVEDPLVRAVVCHRVALLSTGQTPGATKLADQLIENEVTELMRGDVPTFWHQVDTCNLRSAGSPTEMVGFATNSGLSEALRRIESLSVDEIQTQVDLVSLAFAASFPPGSEQTRTSLAASGVDDSDWEPTVSDMHLLVSRLMRTQISDPRPNHPSTWIAPLISSEDNLQWSAGLIGHDLYGGTSSVALSLAAYAHRYRDDCAARTAVAVFGPLSNQVETNRLEGPEAHTEGLVGLPGICWALSTASDLLPDLDVDRGLLLDRMAKMKPLGEALEVVAGQAGTLLCALAIAERVGAHTQSHAAVDSIAEKFHIALERKLADKGAPVDYTGFAHGMGGLIAALLCHHRFSDSSRSLRLAYQVQQLLDDAFDIELNDWPRVLGGAEQSFGWCHGAPGLLLSRLAWRGIDDSILASPFVDRLLELTLQRGLGSNMTYCHGDLGTLEILRIFDTTVGGGELRTCLQQALFQMTHDDLHAAALGATNRHQCSTSLFVGSVGAIWALARVDNPQLHPSPLHIVSDDLYTGHINPSLHGPYKPFSDSPVVHAGLAGGEMTDLWSVITADVGPLSHPNQ